MTVSNDASLRGKCKALAKRHGLKAQEVMQMYFFERFLVRLSQSPYNDRFILKGGLLIASLMGVANRTTMDMDATLRSVSLDEKTAEHMVSEICGIEADDGILFAFDYVEPIRDDDEYGGLRAHIKATFGRMSAPMKIDLTCGDSITPSAVAYPFPLMFDEGSVLVMSYPLATSIAEKFEALVKRGVATTRARDLYDLARLMQIYKDDLDWNDVRRAVANTARHRGSEALIVDYERICHELLESDAIANLWVAYADENSFARTVTLEEAVDAIVLVGTRCIGKIR